MNLDQEVLFELIMAANFMDIKSLLELACAKVASMIKGKTIPDIRKFFNIENDFTPEEEAQIMDENRWAEESFWVRGIYPIEEIPMSPWQELTRVYLVK